MEVCQELVHDPKRLARVQKYARFALSRNGQFRASHIFLGAILKRPHHRGSNRQNGAAVPPGLLDRFRG